MEILEIIEVAKNFEVTSTHIEELNRRIEAFDRHINAERSEMTNEWLNKSFASL